MRAMAEGGQMRLVITTPENPSIVSLAIVSSRGATVDGHERS